LAKGAQPGEDLGVDRRRRAPLLSLVLAVAGAAPPPTAELRVTRGEGAETCDGEDAIARSIEREVKRRAFEAGAPIQMAVEFSREGSIFRARIRVSGLVAGERVIEDASVDCTPLTGAVVLLLTLALDEARSIALAKAATAAVTATSARTPFLPITGGEERSEIDRAPVGLSLEAGGGAAAFAVNTLAPLFTIGASLRARSFRFGLQSLIVYPEERLALSPGEVDVILIGADASASIDLFDTPAIDLAVGLSAAAATIRGRARGFTVNRTTVRPWFAGGVFLRLHGAVWGPLGWYVHTEALFPAHTEAFTVENVGRAYVPPRVTLLPSLGFSWSIE
jgi:hypothetical protein